MYNTAYAQSIMPPLESYFHDPQEDEPRVCFRCDCCGGDIVDGDDYFAIGEDKICENCAEKKTAEYVEDEEPYYYGED